MVVYFLWSYRLELSLFNVIFPNFDLIKYTWCFINDSWQHFGSGSYINIVIIDISEHSMLTEEINVYLIYINQLHPYFTQQYDFKNILLDLLNANK